MMGMALTVLMVGAGAWSINRALAVWHTFNRYGVKAVMEHYLETSQILGKGTHALEGYSMHPESTGRYDLRVLHSDGTPS